MGMAGVRNSGEWRRCGSGSRVLGRGKGGWRIGEEIGGEQRGLCLGYRRFALAVSISLGLSLAQITKETAEQQ